MKPARIEALADAIFAIVMTLLVLELRVPAHMAGDYLTESQNLVMGLTELWPKFLAFIVSFIVIAIFWSGHHIQFLYIKRADFPFMWRNIVFFFFICLIPFSASLLGEYHNEPVALVFYGINLIMCGVLIYYNWAYALYEGNLVDIDEISDELKRNAKAKMLIPPVLYFIAVLAAFVNVQISLLFFALGPIIYFIPVTTTVWEKIVDPLKKK
jgi:uncharacterized membrane protein